jgi:hypothetical protein
MHWAARMMSADDLSGAPVDDDLQLQRVSLLLAAVVGSPSAHGELVASFNRLSQEV